MISVSLITRFTLLPIFFQYLFNIISNKFDVFYRNFTYLHNSKYGNCYTFNSVKDPNPQLYTYYAGPLMGNAFVLVCSLQYLCNIIMKHASKYVLI